MTDVPDLTADTIAVLEGFAEMARSTDRYPGKDEFGDRRTTECLEYARECVERARPAGPVPVLAVRHADGTVTRHAANRAEPVSEPGRMLALDLDMLCSRCHGPHEDVTGTEAGS